MKKKMLIGLLICFTISFTLIDAQAPTVWRGSNQGIYPDKNILKEWPANGPEILWTFENLGQGHSSVVGMGNFVYTTGLIEEEGYLFKFNLNGDLIYKKKYGPEYKSSYNGPRGTPVIVGSDIYLVSGYGVVYCLNESDAGLKWKKDMVKEFKGSIIRWGYNETPVVEGDVIYLTPGGKENCIIALNRKNGSLIWSSKGTGELTAYCTPLLFEHNGKKLLATHSESHLFAVDAKTGDLLWKFSHPNKYSVHANTPVYSNGDIFYFSGYGKGSGKLQINETGTGVKQVWENISMDSRMGGAVLIDGYLYGSGDMNREWKCIDWKTGKNMWESTEIGKGVVISADGMLICYSDRGELALAKADPGEFKVTGKTRVTLGSEQHWAHPAIYKGVLYVRHGQALIAYKIK